MEPSIRSASSGRLTQKVNKILFRNEQDRTRFGRARVRWITAFGRERCLSKRFDRMKDVNDLFFSRRAHPVHVNGAFLHDVKTFGTVAFAKEIFAFAKLLWDNE